MQLYQERFIGKDQPLVLELHSTNQLSKYSTNKEIMID